MAGCTCCDSKTSGSTINNLKPIVLMVPKSKQCDESSNKDDDGPNGSTDAIPVLDEDYIKKNFKVAPRALYLDPFRRPLITFPMNSEGSNNFNMFRKSKINQQILDGLLDPSEAVKTPMTNPYSKIEFGGDKQCAEEEEETIYILQLPDLEQYCPIHDMTTNTPRYVWHSTKTNGAQPCGSGEFKRGGGPLKKPKPWLLSRHTDFDLMSQW